MEILHRGGCHCGAIRFTVKASRTLRVIKCNSILRSIECSIDSCSICAKKQNTHFIVPSSAFTLEKGADYLTTYTYNTHQAKHTFCKICGVQSFYTPRSNPDGYGIMPHCLDPGTVEGIIEENFSGSNWEQSMEEAGDSLKNRSK